MTVINCVVVVSQGSVLIIPTWVVFFFQRIKPINNLFNQQNKPSDLSLSKTNRPQNKSIPLPPILTEATLIFVTS